MEQVFILKENTNTIKHPNDVFKNIKKLNINYNQENVLIFYLDTRNSLIKSEVLFKGGINTSIIDFKIIFQNALKYNANSLLIAHNHPSGDLHPSSEDEQAYKKIKEAGSILMINVLDSIIFNKKEYYSLLSAEV